MESFLIHSAEVVAGIACVAFAVLLFRPLKRFAGPRVRRDGQVFALDEIMVVSWMVLWILGIVLVLYGLTS
ncbi:MAG TPA: hypothetical protein VKA18_04125 [Alphaproteobacteria bacterium]|nr:hypothetical protein [Alphaproteobacteria bacterium]